MHFIRLRAAGRVPVQIQFARIIAPRDGQICHLIRRRAGRALRACIHARAHDLGFIARRRQVHIRCQLRCCRQQRRNRRVLVRGCLFNATCALSDAVNLVCAVVMSVPNAVNVGVGVVKVALPVIAVLMFVHC